MDALYWNVASCGSSPVKFYAFIQKKIACSTGINDDETVNEWDT